MEHSFLCFLFVLVIVPATGLAVVFILMFPLRLSHGTQFVSMKLHLVGPFYF